MSFQKGTRSLIPPFNQYVLDFSNILWRNKAFKETQRVADPFLSVVPNEAVERTLVDGPNDGLSVLRHVGLLGYAYQFLKEVSMWGGVIQWPERLCCPTLEMGREKFYMGRLIPSMCIFQGFLSQGLVSYNKVVFYLLENHHKIVFTVCIHLCICPFF